MLGVSNMNRRDTTSVEVLKVSSKSSPNAVAGALAGVIRRGSYAEIRYRRRCRARPSKQWRLHGDS